MKSVADHYTMTCQPFFYLLEWVPLPVRGQLRAVLSAASVLETVRPTPPLWSGGEPSEDVGLVILWFSVDVSMAEALLSSQYPGSLHFFFSPASFESAIWSIKDAHIGVESWVHVESLQQDLRGYVCTPQWLEVESSGPRLRLENSLCHMGSLTVLVEQYVHW